MTPEAADWVYDVVLTQRYKEGSGAIMWTGAREQRYDGGHGAAFLRACPCETVLCGHCGDGRTHRCTHRSWAPPPVPAAWVVDRAGMAVAAVWMSGRPCRWLCANAPRGQLDLFAVGGAR